MRVVTVLGNLVMAVIILAAAWFVVQVLNR